MTIVIDKSNSEDTSKILNELLKKSAKTGNLTKHFGKLKRGVDGLKIQISVRENEDRFYSRFSQLFILIFDIPHMPKSKQDI